MRHQGSKLTDNEVQENFPVAVKLSSPEFIRKDNAANGKFNLNDIKAIMLNEEAREKELCERSGESQVLNTYMENETKPNGKRCEVHHQKQGGRGRVCYKCGKQNHFFFKFTNPGCICYNFRVVMTPQPAENRLFGAETKWVIKADGEHQADYYSETVYVEAVTQVGTRKIKEGLVAGLVATINFYGQ